VTDSQRPPDLPQSVEARDADVRAVQVRLSDTRWVDLVGELIGHGPSGLMAEALWRELVASGPERRLRQWAVPVGLLLALGRMEV